MYKRKAFSYEEEVRLVIFNGQDSEPPEFQSISLELNESVEHIYINPYAPEYFYNAVKTIVSEFAPKLIDKIESSKLKALPYFSS